MQVKSLIDSFNNAIAGLVHAFRTQRNMKIHFSLAVLVLLSSLFLDISKLELILLAIAITLVISLELINTAIEVVIDMISEEYRFRAKVAKNVAAAAVLLAALNAVFMGYLIFIDKIPALGLGIIAEIQQEPAHLSFITIGLILIIIIAIKAKSGRGTPLQGGLASGHSALAFSTATIIAILTKDIVISALAFLLAFLVVQSRVESRTHSILEVFIGALIGIALTIILFQLM